MWEALGWGLVAASSLVIGAVLGVVRHWKPSQIGVVLGFGAGALISSISFELFEEGLATGGPLPLAFGLAAGALAFFFADRGLSFSAVGWGPVRQDCRSPWARSWTGFPSRLCSGWASRRAKV